MPGKYGMDVEPRRLAPPQQPNVDFDMSMVCATDSGDFFWPPIARHGNKAPGGCFAFVVWSEPVEAEGRMSARLSRKLDGVIW